jgi:hydroxyacylglutathione hydrolase
MPQTAHPAPLTLLALPAFADNYLWLLHDGHHAWVVDPGDAAPVRACLGELGLSLQGILLTHHHADHTGGVRELVQATGATVYGPAYETLPEPVQRLSGGDRVELLGQAFEVLDVPGHTAGHIAYFGAQVLPQPLLFCGDTLFSGGCGRLFEGTPAQMLASLDQLARLPDATRVCCTHEYTLSNLRFARAVEPDNAELAQYTLRCEALRADGKPTLPSRLDTERQINPFLRSRTPSVRAGLKELLPAGADDVATFAALREWKNRF